MKIKFIGITGGSGAGKSTLCRGLQNKYPEEIGYLNLDDYFKTAKVKVENFTNYDHPDSLDFIKLEEDMKSLKAEKKVEIKDAQFYPKPVILVEGFLILYKEPIRNMFDTSIWLDVPQEIRLKRRIYMLTEEYKNNVLIPMHDQFVEPTKKYAKIVIDASNLSKEQVLDKVEKVLIYLGYLKG